MNIRPFLLLMTTIPIFMMSWSFFDSDTREVDWFLFIDFKQKIKWYLYYTSQHLENTIYTGVLYFIIKSHYPRYKWAAFLFFVFAVFRLLEYWMFRHHIPMWPIIAPMILAIILTLKR